jgi:hypothetical protein
MSTLVEESQTHGRVDKKIGALSQAMANRLSRRSFLGRVGATAVAASVGTTASMLYGAGPAQAVNVSEFCGNIMSTMYCNTAYGCYCGCWNAGSCSFCDCCDKGSWCSSHGGCRYPYGNATCCYKKEWTSPAGCGVLNQTLIICRDEFC